MNQQTTAKQENALMRATLFVFFVSGASSVLMGNLMPFLREAYDISYTRAGFLLSLPSWGNIASIFITGYLPSYIGRRKTVLLTAVWMAVAFSLITFGIGGAALLPVACAMIGGLFLVTKMPNVGLGGFPVFTISIVVSFLNMTKQFTGNVNQVSQQINHIAMGLAGAERLFELMDAQPEVDDGYVTLVNAKVDADGTITECAEHTGHWAWKHPHEDGTLTYTLLQGDVRLTEVDFAYEEGKPVLHDVSVYAEPGQKVAFVGSTGAGKTTITNLINRFYDIADGKVRYDGININKIKKADLRRPICSPAR